MTSQVRPDLPNQGLYALLAISSLILLLSLYFFGTQSPGSPAGQWAATFGAIALLVPLVFSLLKRSGYSASPPFWFVAHVLIASLGAWFIMLHAAGGDWFSPPGIVLLLMMFLLVQGVLLRASISERFSGLFARNSIVQGFAKPEALDKRALGEIIKAKQTLLASLDPAEAEALFSPTLRHWLIHPALSLRYQALANKEAAMVGARQSAGVLLAWSRRIHMLAALLFYLGLLAHIIVVLFFAGYAAGDGDIGWWYITDWGRGTH
ncbi:MAG: hypothetical protein IIC58_09505 [Proteobacteria bacterium]|nr:hypothetical protein [Pseudomonadota bacterium]